MEFFKRYAYVILGIVCVLALGGLYMVGRSRPAGVMDAGHPIAGMQEAMAQSPTDLQQPLQQEQTPIPAEPAIIMVHIIGAVISPGVYQVPYGSRVYDVLQLAGGPSEEADLELINLVAFIHDAMQIRIPFVGDEPEILDQGQLSQQNQSATTADGRLNINLANLTELQTLPGIGPARGQSIIDFREAAGRFNTIEDLLNITGIGPAILDNIRDRVTVD